MLQKRFGRETKDIYGVIADFREGIRSFEVLSQGQGDHNGNAGKKGNGVGVQSLSGAHSMSTI